MSKPRLTRNGDAPKPGIVHLGPGAFFRAFTAVYTDNVMRSQGGDWGIVAVSLRSAGVRDLLAPQGGAYSSVTLSPDGRRAQVIGAVSDVLVAPENPSAVLDVMADPATRIVSLTITEKGYCHAPSSGRLRMDHPDIVHDLNEPQAPRSAIGFIVEALARRKVSGAGPFTVLSCDNLPSNGALIRGVVLEFARQRGGDLAGWIEQHVSFPSTMVDRITPATTDEDVALLAVAEGYFDPACVVHEPFSQWVIEDAFCAGRPAWEIARAQMVRDVSNHEEMKLRCLNGTHSTLAYLGYLAGFDTIAQTVANPDFARLCGQLWVREILPTVTQPEGEDLNAYTASLLARYRNPSIQHRTWQIAMDGSQKLPQRLLGTIADNLAKDIVPEGLCLGVAAWMRYVGGVDETGRAIDVRDPLADALKKASVAATEPASKVTALLSFREIFDPELAAHPPFVAAVTASYQALVADGALAAVRDYARTP